MKNFIFLFAFVFISFLFFNSCKSEPEKVLEPENNLLNCCETVPLEASLDTGQIFIPNIFTPDGNGVNDRFSVLSGAGIEEINSFIVRNANGETVFSQQDIMPSTAFLAETSWDGLDNEGNSTSGLFEYEVTVTSVLDDTQTFFGKVCVLICENAEYDFPSENIPNCGFWTQHNANGGWDENSDAMEDNCF